MVQYAFIPNKHFGQLINISPHSLILLKTKNTELPSIVVWFTDHDIKPLEIQDNFYMVLIIG